MVTKSLGHPQTPRYSSYNYHTTPHPPIFTTPKLLYILQYKETITTNSALCTTTPSCPHNPNIFAMLPSSLLPLSLTKPHN